MNDRDLHDMFTRGFPLLDVRAESEFAKGAFPTATNLPILNDEERHQVGLCYKREGPEAAEALGYRLVSGEVKQARVDAWVRYFDTHPEAKLYCFRGGKRSAIAAHWLAEAGHPVERIHGGYKRMRRYLIEQLESPPPLIVLSGRTGCGKTELLYELDNVIDLEGRAHHRGSAFGRYPEPQPSQIDFENAVAIDTLRLDRDRPVWVEDESRMIGSITVPQTLFDHMKTAPVTLLEDRIEARIDRIHREYVVDRWHALRRAADDEEPAHESLLEFLASAMDAIQKRLGGERHRELRKILGQAITAQREGDFSLHRQWIRVLLEEYYDPMYNYQIDRKKERIVFTGTKEEILAWAGASSRNRVTLSGT